VQNNQHAMSVSWYNLLQRQFYRSGIALMLACLDQYVFSPRVSPQVQQPSQPRPKGAQMTKRTKQICKRSRGRRQYQQEWHVGRHVTTRQVMANTAHTYVSSYTTYRTQQTIASTNEQTSGRNCGQSAPTELICDKIAGEQTRCIIDNK
jgi:hypothetical protein